MATYRERGPEGPEKWVRITTNPEESSRFLDRIVGDEEFRARVERNPRHVLKEYGIDLSPGSVPDEVKLPSPERIEKLLRDAQEESLLGEYGGAPYLMLFVVHGASSLAVGDGVDGAG